MNKPLNLVVATLVGIVVIGVSIYGLITPSGRLTVELPGGVDTISIDGQRRSDGQKIDLKPGEYNYTLIGENIDQSSRKVTIEDTDDHLTIVYAPYSSEHLDNLLTSEASSIRQLLTSQYVSKVDGYKIHKIELIDRGQYAVAVLSPEEFDTDNPVNAYRLVLEKNDNWAVVAGPELLLTTTNTQDVGRHILQTANELAL